MKRTSNLLIILCKSSFVILFICLFSISSNAQRRIDTIEVTTGCFRIPITPPSSAPPLKMDMSYKTLSGYIYLDSICRTATSRNDITTFTDRITSFDTLKYFLPFLFSVLDYDPFLYQEYCLYAPHVNPLYHGNPFTVDQILRNKERKILGDTSQIRYMVDCPLIFHVVVTDVHQDSDMYAYIPVHPLPITCVTANILDVIKGKHYYSICSQQNIIQNENNSGCIEFSFSPLWEKEKGRGDVQPVMIDDSGQTHIPCNDCYGSNSVQIGREYIVFLKNMVLDYNGTKAYYDIWPMAGEGRQGGIFPIDMANSVVDNSNFWKLGTTVPIAIFKNHLRDLISTILSY